MAAVAAAEAVQAPRQIRARRVVVAELDGERSVAALRGREGGMALAPVLALLALLRESLGRLSPHVIHDVIGDDAPGQARRIVGRHPEERPVLPVGPPKIGKRRESGRGRLGSRAAVPRPTVP